MFTHISNQTSTSMNPTGDKLTSELQKSTTIEKPVVIGEGQKETQSTLNPTGDKFTAELQNVTHIEQPAVIGQGERTTVGEKIASEIHSTGQTLEAGFGTIASGVEFTGQKLVSGVEFTGEKIKATGEIIGEKLGETFAVAEHTVQKAAEVIAEEKAKVELPGVVTLLQSGVGKLFGHLTGTSTTSTIVVQDAAPAPISPVVPVAPVLKSERKETIVAAEKNLSGDIITTEIQVGHLVDKPTSRIDVLKESGQLGPQSELHLPNLKLRDIPLNRAVEEPIPSTEVKSTEFPSQTEARPFPSFVTIHPAPAEQTESKAEMKEQLPNLTTSVVHDVATFIGTVEQQQKVDNVQPTQKSKDVGSESSEQSKELLPNLTTKTIQDGATFIDQAEHQKSGAQGTANQSADPLLPSLSFTNVQDGAKFLDVVENSGQSL